MINIHYEIKVNTGSLKYKQFEITVDLDDFEISSLVEILLERDYLKCWTNNNEFEVVRRWIE